MIMLPPRTDEMIQNMLNFTVVIKISLVIHVLFCFFFFIRSHTVAVILSSPAKH